MPTWSQEHNTQPDPGPTQGPPDKDGPGAGSSTETGSFNGVASTTSGTGVKGEVLPGLTRLNYNLWHYKTKLFLVAFLLVLESSIIPIALFYGLWLQTTLRHGIIFAIITSFFGLVTGIEFGLRTLKLTLKAGTYRPLGGKRWHFDFTHMTLSFGYTIMTGILIGASIPYEPLVRPLAIPVPLFLVQVGLQLLWTGWMNAHHKPAPFRVSSVPKGGRLPPLVLTIVEDIVAVDGAAGKEYRQNLHSRYEESSRFRNMIVQLNWFWGLGALIDGVGTLVVIWTVPEAVAYGVGWGSPLVFVAAWTWATIVWTRRSLILEKKKCLGVAASSVLEEALSH